MSAHTIADTLEHAAARAVRAMGGRFTQDTGRWSQIPGPIIQEAAEKLRREPELAVLDRSHFRYPGGTCSTNLDYVTSYLVDRAIDVASPEAIAADLLRFLKDNRIQIRRVRAVAGVRAQKMVELGECVRLVPPSYLAEDEPARLIFRPGNVPHAYSQPPSAALVVEEWYETERFQDLAGPPPFDVESGAARAHALFEVGRRACVLASGGAVESREEYVSVLSPGWPFMRSTGAGGAVPPPIRLMATHDVDAAIAAAAFAGMRSHPDAQQIELALSRLESSRHRTLPEERLVDLGTCIEVLLMHGGKNNNEIGYKMATRAAWLIGGDVDERMAIFETAQRLYDDRSNAVHAGKLPGKLTKDYFALEQRIGSYDQLCVRVVLKILAMGRWPDWRRLVLGAPS
jgi:hypothetical protein